MLSIRIGLSILDFDIIFSFTRWRYRFGFDFGFVVFLLASSSTFLALLLLLLLLPLVKKASQSRTCEVERGIATIDENSNWTSYPFFGSCELLGLFFVLCVRHYREKEIYWNL